MWVLYKKKSLQRALLPWPWALKGLVSHFKKVIHSNNILTRRHCNVFYKECWHFRAKCILTQVGWMPLTKLRHLLPPAPLTSLFSLSVIKNSHVNSISKWHLNAGIFSITAFWLSKILILVNYSRKAAWIFYGDLPAALISNSLTFHVSTLSSLLHSYSQKLLCMIENGTGGSMALRSKIRLHINTSVLKYPLLSII